MPQYAYGWKRKRPDFRDLKYAALEGLVLPQAVDLSSGMPPVYDQRSLGSCTANAIGGAIQFLCIKELYKWPFTPSRLFIYYNERAIEGTVMSDSGAAIRDGIQSVNQQGVCPEDGNPAWSWPYSDDPVTFRIKPPDPCYKDAVLHKALKYRAVAQTQADMKSVLAEGFPFVFGITVYDSFESHQVAQTGDVPMPGPNENVLGGHALLCAGYDDSRQRFLFRNSWGTSWGHAGYGTIPYDYLTCTDLGSDYWVITLV